MPKFHVQAVSREGHQGSFRQGRFWPSSGPTEIEVVDTEADPVAAEGEPPIEATTRTKFGTKAYAVLQADPNLIVRPPGDPMASAQTLAQLQAHNARLEAELAQFRKQAGPGGHQPAQPVVEHETEHEGRRKRG